MPEWARGTDSFFLVPAFEPNCVLYLRNCRDCDFTVNVHAAKVMLEGLENCRVELVGKVITSTAEAWKCRETQLVARTKLAWQMDLSRGVTLTYERAADMVQIVWAGMDQFKVDFECKSHAPLETGLDQMREVRERERERRDERGRKGEFGLLLADCLGLSLGVQGRR